jgi:hypothetical protein
MAGYEIIYADIFFRLTEPLGFRFIIQPLIAITRNSAIPDFRNGSYASGWAGGNSVDRVTLYICRGTDKQVY